MAMATAMATPREVSASAATKVARPSGKLWIPMATAVMMPIFCRSLPGFSPPPALMASRAAGQPGAGRVTATSAAAAPSPGLPAHGRGGRGGGRGGGGRAPLRLVARGGRPRQAAALALREGACPGLLRTRIAPAAEAAAEAA